MLTWKNMCVFVAVMLAKKKADFVLGPDLQRNSRGSLMAALTLGSNCILPNLMSLDSNSFNAFWNGIPQYCFLRDFNVACTRTQNLERFDQFSFLLSDVQKYIRIECLKIIYSPTKTESIVLEKKLGMPYQYEWNVLRFANSFWVYADMLTKRTN